jgi:hypothetical protein
MKELNKRIVCKDGFSISVQANEFSYCNPRGDEGPYTHVECGFPSSEPKGELLEFAEDPDKPTQTVYPYVPVSIVMAELELHGGIESGKLPE